MKNVADFVNESRRDSESYSVVLNIERCYYRTRRYNQLRVIFVAFQIFSFGGRFTLYCLVIITANVLLIGHLYVCVSVCVRVS